MTSNLYIGLMSGTSLDGIDAVIVDFRKDTPHLIGASHTPFMPALREQLLDLCEPGENGVHRMAEADRQLANFMGACVNRLLAEHNLLPNTIKAIGSHGQTIRHQPKGDLAYTVQIGDPNTLVERTKITVVADFRRRDIASGGQGAPLVPAFHRAIFGSPNKSRAIVNIGGIANVTLLPADKTKSISGFDTGPGNTLLDQWCETHCNKSYDHNGEWAASGTCHIELLSQMRDDPYFSQPAPKSTGREYFNMHWLRKFPIQSLKPEDVQATLLHLTAIMIADACQEMDEIYICGGGAHNGALMKVISEYAKAPVQTTEALDVSVDLVEAIAFAWLAKQTLEKKPGNVSAVTGASAEVILGGIYQH